MARDRVQALDRAFNGSPGTMTNAEPDLVPKKCGPYKPRLAVAK